MPLRIAHPNTGGGSGFSKDAHVDHLLAFVGINHEPDTQTRFGLQDAAHVETVVCLDERTAANDVLIFGNALVPALVDVDGDVVIGRLVKGEAKAGQSPPWLLEDPTPEDDDTAAKFFDAYATTLRSGRVVIEMPTGDEKF